MDGLFSNHDWCGISAEIMHLLGDLEMLCK